MRLTTSVTYELWTMVNCFLASYKISCKIRDKQRHCNHWLHKYEEGRFLVSATCVAISKPDMLSISGTGVTPWMRSWKKKPLIWMSLMSESNWNRFYTDVKSWDSTTLFRIWPGSKAVSSNLLAQPYDFSFFCFCGGNRVLWNSSSRLVKWHQCCLWTSHTFIMSSHL
jgi:hypothetical protein